MLNRQAQSLHNWILAKPVGQASPLPWSSFNPIRDTYSVLVTIVTGAGAGINHALARILSQRGCSVVMADLRLLPEAETTLQEYRPSADVKDKPSAIFFQIDLAYWTQLQKLFDTTLEMYGTVNILVNGAGIYEAPSSNFWQPPGIGRTG